MKKIVLFIAIFLPLSIYSQRLTSYKNVVPDGYNFWVYTPQGYDSTRFEKPLIIFLHGSSLCGNDLSRVRRYGCLDALEMGKKIDAVIMAPQNPGGAWIPKTINNVFEWVASHYSIDTNRIYVLGMSLGGYGTIDYVGTYPEKIAAAMALCGGGTLKSYCGLTQVPLWILHGNADRDVSINESRKIISSMVQCGDTSLLRFDELKGMNHSQLARAFYIDETYQWLFSHRLNDTICYVNKDIVITPETMSGAYQNVNRANNQVGVVCNQSGQVETAQSERTSSSTYYTVKKGDTLFSIARKYHTSVANLCKLNKIKETSILSIGKRLKLR